MLLSLNKVFARFPDEYPIGEVSERWKDKYAVWLVRDSEKIFVLSTVCTHLGCTPNWLGAESKFRVPVTAAVFIRPASILRLPRPLERFKIYLADDGQIVIDKTKVSTGKRGVERSGVVCGSVKKSQGHSVTCLNR